MGALATTASGGRPETSPVVPVSSVQLPSDSSGIAGATPAAVQGVSPESVTGLEENPEMAAEIAAMTAENNLIPPSEAPPVFVDDQAALALTPEGILAAKKLKRPDLQDATDNPLRTVLSNLPLKRKTTAERAAEKSLTPSEIAANRARFAEQENERTGFFKGIGDADMPASTVETKNKTSRGIPAALKKTLVPTSVTVPDIGELRDVEDVTSTTSPSDNREPRTMYDDTSDGTGGEGTGTGTGTPRESAPKYVPVDMNNANNDDLGCPSGYARVFDPATGQPICGRIDEPSAPGPAAPAEEAEEEDGVVIDIPITERPKISPYYVPEMVESNYTPYVPGRRASTQ